MSGSQNSRPVGDVAEHVADPQSAARQYVRRREDLAPQRFTPWTQIAMTVPSASGLCWMVCFIDGDIEIWRVDDVAAHKVAWPEMGGDAVFTADEYRYLAARRDGRLVTIGAGDAPQIHPVSFRIDAEGGAIEIGGPRIRDSQKYRNIRRDPRVSLIVDDETAPLQGSDAAGARGVQIRGMAELSERPPPAPGMGTDVILIRPVRIDAWNVAQPGHYSRFVT